MKKTLFLLLLLCSIQLRAQKHFIGLSGSYGVLVQKYAPYNLFGTGLHYEVGVARHVTVGAEASWQFIEPVEITLEDPFGAPLVSRIDRHLLAFRPSVNWYFSERLRGFFAGVLFAYQYMTITTRGLVEGSPYYDPTDEFSASAGLRYGYRLPLGGPWRISAQGSHEMLWLEEKQTDWLHHWSLNIGYVFGAGAE